ncbi:MAG TPA: formyltetrahydrofolate deformylase [Microthrixaceae bacterium]|nr:formyltetrahydrofolate deformylase [Microthrixaceae bacterium]HNI34021.1 formyltetrahydrofolate deformylase [Microthrixaceae bacterium]
MTVLLLSCPDRPGLVAATSTLIHHSGGNIAHADQHADDRHGLFVQRIEFEFPDGRSLDAFRSEFAVLAESLDMEWEMVEPDQRARVALLVSREGHCLLDLLSRIRLGELAADVPVVISNHEDHREITEHYGVPFLHLPVDPVDKSAQQRALLDALKEADVELIVMARYMQILPSEIIDRFPRRIINIHHSFLPAFVGAKPYHQAYDRGVKIIGATAHYATAELDQGPIICQEVTPVSHRDTPDRLIRLGGDLEQTVLARAVRLHLERRILSYANRTVIFD